MDYEQFVAAVNNAAAIRRLRRMQPAGGPGDKIFPPTYPAPQTMPKGSPPRHAVERRRLPGYDGPVECVLVDSVQSQANRLEEGLALAVRDGRIAMPRLEVRFADKDLADIGAISTLEAPHRLADAIFRDSLLRGKPFRESEEAKRFYRSSVTDATALFELSPNSLIFGVWNSTGVGGGLGAKFARVLVSELIGVNAVLGVRSGSRIDPLGILRATTVYENQEDKSWVVAATPKGEEIAEEIKGGKQAKKWKAQKPSEINHGNIAPTLTDQLGATVDHVQHSLVLSLAGLRRLRFPVDGQTDPARDAAARVTLAALALVAAFAQDARGYALRSRCDLVPEPGQPTGFETIGADGDVRPLALSPAAAETLLAEAGAKAKEHGLRWGDTITLHPSQGLIDLVRDSRRRALAGEGGKEDEE